MDLALKCACGKVAGKVRDVSPQVGNRLSCYCDDCQAFAHHLGAEATTLDEHGGTNIYQVQPNRVSIEQGIEHVACFRLSINGLMRWHTSCCNSPIGNTMPSIKWPFIGLVHTFIDTAAAGVSLDEAVGPSRQGVHGRLAQGGCPSSAHPKASVSTIARGMKFLLAGYVKGAGRPSPFFDQTGKPVAEPQVASKDERAALKKKINPTGIQ